MEATTGVPSPRMSACDELEDDEDSASNRCHVPAFLHHVQPIPDWACCWCCCFSNFDV